MVTINKEAFKRPEKDQTKLSIKRVLKEAKEPGKIVDRSRNMAYG